MIHQTKRSYTCRCGARLSLEVSPDPEGSFRTTDEANRIEAASPGSVLVRRVPGPLEWFCCPEHYLLDRAERDLVKARWRYVERQLGEGATVGALSSAYLGCFGGTS
jgi:hypothetical protein